MNNILNLLKLNKFCHELVFIQFSQSISKQDCMSFTSSVQRSFKKSIQEIAAFCFKPYFYQCQLIVLSLHATDIHYDFFIRLGVSSSANYSEKRN